MNRSFRAPEREKMGSLRTSVMRDTKDEDLALFREMRKREKERNGLLLLQNSEEFVASLGSRTGSSPIFNLTSAARKTVADDFLDSENYKNDYEWLLTPPGTPLFPSLEMESQRTVSRKLESPKAHPTAIKSRLANAQPEPGARSNIASRQHALSTTLSASSGGVCRPSSSGGPGSRPATPTGRPTLSSTSRSTLTSSASRSTLISASNKPTLTTAPKTTAVTSKITSNTASKPSRSATPTSRATLLSSKPNVSSRSSTPTRSTTRSSTQTTRPSVPETKSTSRAATPTRRPMPVSSATSASAGHVMSPTSSSSVTKPVPTTAKNPGPSRSNSPSVRPRPWKPSDMPGFSLDAPPNLRTSLNDRSPSATRGRPGAPSSRSSSVEPISNGRIRRQSCSPARGRLPSGIIHSSGSSVPVAAVNRLHAKANANVSPVLMGNKMVERVINMRKLAPPKQDDKCSPHSNLSGKSSSPDSSGFGRTLSKKSLDMAIRHMDIRRKIPGNLRPLMTNIPASSMYSVRSGPNRSRVISVSDSPLATSSNASSEVSVNNALCVDRNEGDDDVSSDKGIRTPAKLRGR